MAEETKTEAPTDNVGDRHDDGLWPDFDQSAESSVHENLPKHFAEDNLFPDEELSVQSVQDGADVLHEHGFGKDTLIPDEEQAQETAKATADELEAAEAARTSGGDSQTPEGATDGPDEGEKRQAPAKKAAAKKTAAPKATQND